MQCDRTRSQNFRLITQAKHKSKQTIRSAALPKPSPKTNQQSSCGVKQGRGFGLCEGRVRFTLPRIAFGQSFFLRHSKLAQALARRGAARLCTGGSRRAWPTLNARASGRTRTLGKMYRVKLFRRCNQADADPRTSQTRRSGGGWERAGARDRGRVGVAYERKYGKCYRKRRSVPPQQLPEIWGKLAARG